MSRYYPVYLDLPGKRCIVVGGGTVAERKVGSLLKGGADVWIVSPDLSGQLKELVDQKKVRYIKERFEEGHLKDAFLVIGATDDPSINSRISREAQRKGILVNIVDLPGDCNFIVPSVVERGNMVISISTGGKSPALSKKIRKELEQRYGEEYDEFIDLMGEIREYIMSEVNDGRQRSLIFQRLVDSKIIDLLKKGRRDLAEEEVARILRSMGVRK
ncbi:MAG: bifunctional precorrin-2 dehydrogenase/sirohydrochlorin ferrochelatase [Nitrospinota bacterium]